MRKPIPQRWLGETCVVIASGPSLTPEQCQAVMHAHIDERVRVIAVNREFKSAPWADVYYGGDFLMWRQYIADMRVAAKRAVQDLQTLRPAEFWTVDGSAHSRYQINRVQGANQNGLGEHQVHFFGNSGAQAINLAYLWGCKKIVLLGFDMREVGGRRHHFGDHPKPLVQAILPGEWIHKMKAMGPALAERGVFVANCTPGSALPWFPMGTLSEHL